MDYWSQMLLPIIVLAMTLISCLCIEKATVKTFASLAKLNVSQKALITF